MKRISVSETWYRTTMLPFLEVWRSAALKRKVNGAILGMLDHQRTNGEPGKGELFDKPCIPVPREDLDQLFTKWETQKRFCHLAVEMGVVQKDGSWVSPSIAKKAGKDPYCNSWHITEPDIASKRHIEVEYDENLSLIGSCFKEIRKAEGFDFNGDRFSGAWAIDEFISGRLNWSDLIEVRKCARQLIRGTKPKKGEPPFRVFDAFTQCRRDLREKCFTNVQFAGQHPIEVFDIHGAHSFTSVLAAAALGFTSFQDNDLYTWAYNLVCGAPIDPYKRIWKGMMTVDPNTNCIGRKWTDEVRAKVKKSVSVAENCNQELMKRAKENWHAYFNGEKVSKQSRRLWVAFLGIKEANPNLFECIMRTKASNRKNAFYWLGVMGEKMLMDLLVSELTNAGHCVHRVHDALWSSDPRLKDVPMDKVVGRIVLNFIKSSGSQGFGRNSINALASKFISKEDKEWMSQFIDSGPWVKAAINRLSIHGLK